MTGDALIFALLVFVAVAVMVFGAWRRKRKINNDPVRYHKLAAGYVSKCLENNREIEPEIIDYFLKDADPDWAMRVGYEESSDNLTEIDSVRRKRGRWPRRYEISLSSELQESFARKAGLESDTGDGKD